MTPNSPENNTTIEIKNSNTRIPIISTEGTHISESPKGKKITYFTSEKTREVKKEIKTQFDIISKNTEYNQILQEVIDGTAFYIDSQLGKDFSKIEKDNIKLVLLSYLTEKVNNIDLSIINGINNGIEKKLKGILNLFKNEKDNDIKKEKFNKLFKTLGINGLQKDLDDKIVQIKNDRENKNFKKIGEAFNSIEGINKPEGEIFNNIQAELKKASLKFDKFSNIGKKVKGTADKLGMGNILQDIILWLQKEFPFFGSILTMFLGGMENNSNNKKEKSTTNLINFIQNKNYSPLDEIENKSENTLKEKLKSEKLKDFYKYLDSKKIDYSDKNFWSNFLKGENKHGDDTPEKVSNLKKLFDETFKDGDSMQDISLDDFIKKLNGLGKKETQEEVKKTNKEIKELEAQLGQQKATQKTDNIQSNVQQNTTQKTDKTNTQKDTNLNNVQKTATIVSGITKKTSSQKIENNKVNVQKKAEILKRIYNLKFKKSLLKIKSLPADIIDFRDGKIITLDIIDNKKIKLGNNTYTIKINTENFGDKFEKIEFKNQEFLLNGEKSISKDKAITLLRDLINKNKFTFKGSTKKLFLDINYEVVIKKV